MNRDLKLLIFNIIFSLPFYNLYSSAAHDNITNHSLENNKYLKSLKLDALSRLSITNLPSQLNCVVLEYLNPTSKTEFSFVDKKFCILNTILLHNKYLVLYEFLAQVNPVYYLSIFDIESEKYISSKCVEGGCYLYKISEGYFALISNNKINFFSLNPLGVIDAHGIIEESLNKFYFNLKENLFINVGRYGKAWSLKDISDIKEVKTNLAIGEDTQELVASECGQYIAVTTKERSNEILDKMGREKFYLPLSYYEQVRKMIWTPESHLITLIISSDHKIMKFSRWDIHHVDPQVYRERYSDYHTSKSISAVLLNEFNVNDYLIDTQFTIKGDYLFYMARDPHSGHKVVRIINYKTNQLINTLYEPDLYGSFNIKEISISDNGKYLTALEGDDNIKIWQQ